MGSRLVWLALAAAQAPIPGVDEPLTLREQTCRTCYRACPISCFTGTCGLSFGKSVNRFGTSNSCWTCDQSASVGISRVGDFSICTPEESAAVTLYLKKKDPLDGPWGPAVPGDARAAALAAATSAQSAMDSAREAAQHAEKAAQAAVANYQAVNTASDGTGSEQQLAEAHRLAETIRAQDAEQAARAAEEARKVAENKYQDQLEALRRQELLTEQSEDVVARTEKAAEDARAAATKQAAKAAEAARAAAMIGAAAAGRAAQQAEADELAAAARAAQRRAIIAATAAKAAFDKASIAGDIAKIPDQSFDPGDPCAAKVAAAVAAATPAAAALLQDPACAPTPLLRGAKAPEAPAPAAPAAPATTAPAAPTAQVGEAAGPDALISQASAEQQALQEELQREAQPPQQPPVDVDALKPALPTLIPLPAGTSPDDEGARMANAVVAGLELDPQSLQAQGFQQDAAPAGIAASPLASGLAAGPELPGFPAAPVAELQVDRVRKANAVLRRLR